MNKQIFGTYIAENRKQLGMTQAQLADRLHVTDKAVSKWERGLSYPDVTLLEPLAEALSVSIDALLRCRMPADEGKEQTMTEERNSEPIQTVMEISKETVQRKKLGSKLLAAALAVVIAAAGVLVIPRAVREYRAAQEAKHHHEVNCAKVDMIYVEQMPGSENSGEYICVVGYEGKLLYLPMMAACRIRSCCLPTRPGRIRKISVYARALNGRKATCALPMTTEPAGESLPA